MRIDVRILGPLEVERDGELVALGGRRQRAVLAVLVLHAREAMSPDRLADLVWGGEPPASADTTLRSYVSNLRKALEPGETPSVLRTTPSGYVLDVGDEQMDARCFERLVADARRRSATGDATSAAEVLSRALQLWRGEALQDFAYDDFAQADASRLADLRFACTEDLFEARLELGQHDAVVGDLEVFSNSHPGRERALRLRMLALYRCGRQAEALDAYEEGRRRLADELGIDPSPELRALHEQIVRQDGGLSAPTAPADVASGKQTLTFMLGDIERSTAKLRALGDDYPAVLEEHRRTLKEALASGGGRAVRTYGGDEVFAAFDTATDAVGAAVDAQLALCRAGFGEERTLPVRMGLHTGDATYSDGEYVGLAIHLAARIMDAAHGGQVLVSQATKELFEAEEGSQVELLDSGVHALKDIPDTVRLHQVVHPELRRDFPPLRTRSDRTDNLPSRLKSFVGRDPDLERIEEAHGDARVVTLTGVGGVGKTSLAVEAGRRLVPRYPDGVWLCELAPVGDADGIVHSVATTLGVEQQRGSSMRKSLLAALGQRETLVILDNCEHLLAPVAELVEDIIARSRGTDILVTSREALDVEGERTRPVRSLTLMAGEATGVADAMQLFEDRAQERRPDFRIDGTNVADVAGICAKLDGIPLAIELAAARVTSLSPAQIGRRLEEGFRFLRSGRRAAVDRHRTLHGAIDWSYALLSESERLLFDRLSVFAGGFTLEAAEEVCGPGLDLDVADGLASLVAKSLVDADVSGAEARYSLLETMRQYGQDRLAEREDAEETLRLHAAYFVRLLEEVDVLDGDSEGLIGRTLLELDNLRAAHAWTITAGDADLALRLSTTDELARLGVFPMVFASWAEAALRLPEAEEHPLYPMALTTYALGLVQRGERKAADELAARAREMVEGQDDPRRLRLFTNAAFFEGRMDEFRRDLEDALRLARTNGDVYREFFALYGRTLTRAYAGEHAAAIEDGETACLLVRDRSTLTQGMTLYALGEALRESGDLERALDCLERSVDLSQANGARFNASVGLLSAATIRDLLGDSVSALPMFREVIEYWRLSALWVQQWITLRNLAELFGRLGADEPATVLLAASEASATAVPSFGAQAERLDALRAELEQRLGPEYASAFERGRAMSDEEAVAFAKAEIDRAAEASRVAEV